MFRRLAKTLILLLCCWLLTGPQLLLQLGAWSWMMASYSQESSIEQAFKETFGGDRPCDLCKIIQAVDVTEQEAPTRYTESEKLNLMLGLATPILIGAPKASLQKQLFIVSEPENALLTVPTPPPRAV